MSALHLAKWVCSGFAQTLSLPPREAWHGTRVIIESPSADLRCARAAEFLAARADERVIIVGATYEAAAEVSRRALALSARKASLGWERTTMTVLSLTLAQSKLIEQNLLPVAGLALEALCARIIHKERAQLSRLAPIVDKPGLPRALARTLLELRLAGVPPVHDRDLAHLVGAFTRELETLGLADRAALLALAQEQATLLPPAAFVFVDVPLDHVAQSHFVAALHKRASAVFATVPVGDPRSRTFFESALAEAATREDPPAQSALASLQRRLFASGGEVVDKSDAITVLSAPGTNRECVELARVLSAEMERGTPLDRMAVLMRSGEYVPHIQEALRRASIPAYFARGSRAPDPSGRALLALLACAAEGLSARRFSEYLSLGEMPSSIEGTPPAARAAALAPNEDSLRGLRAESEAEEAPDDQHQGLVAPRHWEKLLVDASVIGGRERWERRLGGLHAKLEHDRAVYERDGDAARASGVERDVLATQSLTRFALPLIAELASLPVEGTWGEWIAALEALATRALRKPERALALLQTLAPMRDVGGVRLEEVRLVLETQLAHVVAPPTGRRYGLVFVGSIEEARGLSFDVVCIPGLAEKIFPQKIVEDPLLLDDERAVLGASLQTSDDRAEDERLALHLAIGAASRRVVLSYPRLDSDQGRPRTPSFYALEVLRVIEGGALKDFEHLAQLAAMQTHARLGWPAPQSPLQAIDEAEYDLAVLGGVLRSPEQQTLGAANYLLNVNEHLARALRFRGRRWLKSWKGVDGLVDPAPEALEAIAAHTLAQRSFSPTALQHYAACPYRFLLSAVHRLAPRDEPSPIEDVDPLTRGSLVHETQFELLIALRAREWLPVRATNLDAALLLLDETVAMVADRFKDAMAPAIARVWDDAIESIAADLREWLRRMTTETTWTPAFFELSFGLPEPRAEDAQSQKEALVLGSGLQLRGSIDLIERSTDGSLRAVDHKTGKPRTDADTVIAGGEILQPVLYALALEQRFPGVRVDSGVLYYCTARADFATHRVPLDTFSRSAEATVSKVIGAALETGFLPAAPKKDACRYCDYVRVCGPEEETRTKRKPQAPLKDLIELRKLP